MSREGLGEQTGYLSTLPAGRSERRAALAFVLVSTAAFLMLAAIATRPMAPMPAFIPAYQTALILNDLITAAFLLNQFNALKTRGLLLLASGYLFTATLAVTHLLSFPGLLSANGLVSSGPQTTAWLYMFWHAGFPILVIVYALSGDRRIGEETSPGAAMVLAVALTLGAAAALTLLATIGAGALPAMMRGDHYLTSEPIVIAIVWLLSLLSLLALLLRRPRPHSVLDLWLMVVATAWLFDIALSGGLNAGRFDLGFYAGRIYGLMAASFVLLVLMTHHGVLYARLIVAHELERRLAAELRRISNTDALTGVANRRAFEQALDSEWRRTLRYKTPLSLLMIDVDYFKRYNDSCGHIAGDECLRQVAGVIVHNARRAGEVAARYGGEEFAILAPHIGAEEAKQLADRICEQVRKLNIPHAASAAADHVTVSIGVAGAAAAMRFEPDAGGGANDNRAPIAPPSPATLVASADKALYAAKTAGRNRVCMMSDSGELDTTAESAARSGVG
ncbi:MAG TPA: sensor domain-containing diguanylate cyclase [Roseiarcus sp.]|nr:sensor domain-containing diguanylate cyclase [Roseiarcus sp.]